MSKNNRKGKGWRGESKRHAMARMGYKTVLPDGRRLHMGNFVAGGKVDFGINFTQYANILDRDNQIIGEYIVEDKNGNPYDHVPTTFTEIVNGTMETLTPLLHEIYNPKNK